MDLENWLYLISQKILVSEKCLNFHTVKCKGTNLCISNMICAAIENSFSFVKLGVVRSFTNLPNIFLMTSSSTPSLQSPENCIAFSAASYHNVPILHTQTLQIILNLHDNRVENNFNFIQKSLIEEDFVRIFLSLCCLPSK